MHKKNVVLLGGSNSVMTNGLQKGLREGIEELNITNMKQNLEFYNLALGSITSIQNFYELKRERNKEKFLNAELIISETNINDIIGECHSREKLPINILYRNLYWFYQELYFLNKKILILLLPFQEGNYKTINNIHKTLIQKFNFNLIDMQNYYENKNLEEFGNRIDQAHQQENIMKEIGKNIIKNIHNFKIPKKPNLKNDNPKFKICTPEDMEPISGNLEKMQMKNSMYDETTYIVDKNIELKFPSQFQDHTLIAIHTWNGGKSGIRLHSNNLHNYSTINFLNKSIKLSKHCGFLNSVLEFHYLFTLDDKSIINCKHNDNVILQEHYHAAYSWDPNSIQVEYCNLIGFLLASPDGNYHTEQIDFKALTDENIKISREYNFDYLIPPIELYKEIIDEYCSMMDPRKLIPLQNQIKERDSIISILNDEKIELQNKLNSLSVKKQILKINNLKSAKSRIQNQLSYKLGQAMIVNSKSILGYIRMPFVLSYIKDKHKQEQKIYQEKIKKDPSLKLPSLEDYPDYKEALKEKECFTYKLGEALIRANNNWYGGGISNYCLRLGN
ncbi:alpha-2,3-sialyltransferase [Campylobacter coli]|nr:alpha-2,3-sialyltransferase [Campylobacter coli]EAL3865332.1 alpha-2,3-sialyltransferase [Campylobacter coli]